MFLIWLNKPRFDASRPASGRLPARKRPFDGSVNQTSDGSSTQQAVIPPIEGSGDDSSERLNGGSDCVLTRRK